MTDTRGLRFSPLAAPLARLASFRRLRGPCARLASRWEGGDFYSGTLRAILSRYCGIEVGAYSYGPCLVPGRFPAGVTIGRYVSMASGVQFAHRNHPLDRLSTHPFFYNATLGYIRRDNIPSSRLEIGHDAWIGANAFITAGCSRIGIGAVVAACSVVTHDVDDFAIVGGNPARLIRYRFPPETMSAILASRWWELKVEDCIRVLAAMTVPLDEVARHPLIGAVQGRDQPVSC